MSKKIVRLKISDFIDTPIEDSVISFLSMIKKETPNFTTVFWYYNGEIDATSISKFKMKYGSDIETLEVQILPLIGNETAVWYDIVSEKDSNILQHFKFRSIYDNTNKIIDCILEFNTMIKFDTQKNNGYRNGKDRNNRFKALGRQAEN